MEGYHWYLHSLAANYGSSPNFVDGRKLLPKGFASLYACTEETAAAILEAGTAKYFKGVVWSKVLWLDFDGEDAAKRAEEKLKGSEYEYSCYTTGNRGLHFAVSRDALPSHLLPQQDKAWVREHFPEADSSIYTHLHPFRVEGTLHTKTGNPKRRLYHRPGVSLSLPPFKEQESKIVLSNENRQGNSIFDCFRVMAYTVPVAPGDRHRNLVRLLYALKDDAGVDAQGALWWVTEWNKTLSEPKEQAELEKAVRSIYG